MHLEHCTKSLNCQMSPLVNDYKIDAQVYDNRSTNGYASKIYMMLPLVCVIVMTQLDFVDVEPNSGWRWS